VGVKILAKGSWFETQGGDPLKGNLQPCANGRRPSGRVCKRKEERGVFAETLMLRKLDDRETGRHPAGQKKKNELLRARGKILPNYPNHKPKGPISIQREESKLGKSASSLQED